MKLRALSLAVALAASGQTFATETDTKAQLDTLSKQLEALQAKIKQLETANEEQEEAIEATAEAVEKTSGLAEVVNKVHIGGYGELHYNNLDGSGGASDKDEIDFHRFVLMFGYDFTDDIRFFSELELEHALSGDDKPGEVELEQAYIDFDINDSVTARGGLFLLPIGILNETHEPATFYGVERNPVEKNIIPTTWWESGGGIYGEVAEGVRYDLYMHSGLKTSADKSYNIRSGRQKSANADADDFAYTAAIRYTAIPGLELGGSFQYQGDMTQSEDPEAGSAFMLQGHAAYQKGQFGLRALAAYWDLDGDGPADMGADEQFGFFVEPSWRFNEEFGIFARYNFWDNQAGESSIESEKKQYDLGVNYWPHAQVVLKADYQIQDNENGKEQDGFNLGIGYHF
ncbi:porin [Corallincola spongiicola]|uniref:Porin n=1 Tax=Corallincola spongiicola TaxID=2520508 RepID=A0ABY1WL42_9GAMM|nr:porin [Corallincola spongiicola]TAA41044.1 porin [Corallincola spongiicola]